MDNEAAYLTRPAGAFPLNALHKAIGDYRREVSVLWRLDEPAKVWLGFGIGEERKNLDEGRKGTRLRCAREIAKGCCELAKVMGCTCTPKSSTANGGRMSTILIWKDVVVRSGARSRDLAFYALEIESLFYQHPVRSVSDGSGSSNFRFFVDGPQRSGF